jgi:hypothetical protein
VTPILSLDDCEERVDTLWQMLQTFLEIRWEPTCMTHVHVGIVNGQYSLAQLKRLAKCIGFFDNAFFCGAPSDGRWSKVVQGYARSNLRTISSEGIVNQYQVAVDQLQGGNPGPFFSWCDQHHSIKSIVGAFCSDRNVAWNFLPLLDTRGTIEFRLAPQVLNKESAMHSPAFALGFIQSVLAGQNLPASTNVPAAPASADELNDFVLAEAEQMDIHQHVISIPEFFYEL